MNTCSPSVREARPSASLISARIVLAVCLQLGLAVSCGEAQQRDSVAPTTAGWQLSDLASRPEWKAEGATVAAAGGARQAILVAADAYERHPEWRVYFAGTNIDRMRALLMARAGVPEAGMQVLRGRDVHRDALQAAIRDAGNRFRGTGNLLVIYFTGHAGVDASGVPLFFTYYSTTNTSGGFEQVVPRDDVHVWLAEAKSAARARGVEFQVLLIVDACRVSLLAPPPLARITPSADWEWYGTREGRFAEAPSGDAASPFTDALVTAADQIVRATGEATLQQLAVRTRQLTRESTRGQQDPELLEPAGLAESPVILQRGQVVFAVQAVDAVTRLPLENAVIRVGASEGATTPVVRTPPGRLLLRLTAQGYLRRADEVEVSSERSG